LGDGPVRGVGQPGENVSEILKRIDAPAAAAFNDGVEDGTALSGVSIAKKEPVFLAQCCGANGIFHQVVVDFYASILEVDTQEAPVGEGVIDGFAKGA